MFRPAIASAALLILAILIPSAVTHAQTAADSAAIVITALDYIEGWYEGNEDRMERALHPDLAKRIVRVDPESGEASLSNMTADQLIAGARRGGGSGTPVDNQRKDVTILDIFGNAASVKIIASDWIDYLHVAKYEDDWVIVNVLWELKPEVKERMGGGGGGGGGG